MLGLDQRLAESRKKILIILFLALLSASVFFISLKNFENNKLVLIDENVYYSMAKQVLEEGPSGYNAIPYGKHLEDKGRALPEYFHQPLFKHPPVFTILTVLSLKLFGASPAAAEYVALALSVLMIPLIFLFATQIFNRSVGLLAALFLWMDPVTIICSQRIWPESTIAFFMLLSATLFIRGLKGESDWCFILSGVASGLAVNTKYTGVFVTFAVVLYCLIYRRDLFRNKMFQGSLALPFFMLVPWVCWNYQIYGIRAVLNNADFYSFYTRVLIDLPAVIFLAIVGAGIVSTWKWCQREGAFRAKRVTCFTGSQNFRTRLSFFVAAVFFLVVIPKQFLHSLELTYLPTSSLVPGFFAGEPMSFYFGRLLEYSPVYIFSFMQIFRFDPVDKNEAVLVRLSALLILLFFTFWNNYQSRYILSSLPFFIVLGAQFIVDVYKKTRASRNRSVRFGGKVALTFALIFIIGKCYYVNVMMSYPNHMVYF